MEKETKQTWQEIRLYVQTEVPYRNTEIRKDIWLHGSLTSFRSGLGQLVTSAAPEVPVLAMQTPGARCSHTRGWPPAKGPCAISGPEHGRAELQAQDRVSAATQSLSFSRPSP